MSTRWDRVRALYRAALERPAGDRPAFLAAECGDDVELRGEVESLLDATAEADGFLDPPGADAVQALLEVHAAPLAEGTRVGPFRVRRVLGAGGMGVVYEAEQDRPRRRVALKVMRHGAGGPDAALRFRYEAEILATLHHPAIATVYETGVHRIGGVDVPWLAMEHVQDARDIVSYCEESGASVEARLSLLARVCDAVHHGHVRGVIHRDLKPGNLLVDDRGEPRVIDFGIAHMVDPEFELSTLKTQEGAILGTLATMSPEQVGGAREDVDLRSDVYALGAVLYRLLTGRFPHEVGAMTLPEAARAILEAPPPRPGALDPRLAGDLETIVLKALEKEPDRRYPSAAALGEDLERFLAGRPIHARPPSFAYQARMFTRRHRALVGALVAVAAVSLAAAGVSLRFGLDANDSARDATRRYGLVRELGRDLLYDLLGELEGVVGAAGARARVAEVATTYLDALEQEAGDDVETLADLLVGHHRVGVFIGDPGTSSLGRLEEAEEHLVRALDTAARIAELAPDRADLLASVPAVRLDLGRVRERRGDSAGAERLFVEALADAEARGAHDQAALARVFLGDRAADAGEHDLAVRRYEDALAAYAQVPGGPAPLSLTYVHDRLAGIALERGELERAERHLTLGRALAAQAAEATPGDTESRVAEVEALGNLAVLEDRRGRHEASRQRAAEAVAAAEALAADDPRDAHVRNKLAWALEQRGVAELGLGDPGAARPTFARAAELLERSLVETPGDLVLRTRAAELRVKECLAAFAAGEAAAVVDLARASAAALAEVAAVEAGRVDRERALCLGLDALGQILLELEALDEARGVVERYVESARRVADLAPGDAFAQRQVLLAEDRLGMVHEALGNDAALPVEERRASLATAVRSYRDCLATFASLEERGLLQPGDEQAVPAVEAAIAACEAARDRLGAD